MGWSVGYDDTWHRDVGYGVPATCDQPGCGRGIDRGLAYVCGGEPYGGDKGCGLYFCGDHMSLGPEDDDPQMCDRCRRGEAPYEPTPDTAEWMTWKLTDDSWRQWRSENPIEVDALRAALGVVS